MARVVVDTNILFSALISAESAFAEALLRSEHEFFVCEMTLVEIFKHKEKLVKAARISEDDMARLYHILLRRVTVYKEDLIAPEHRKSAYALCRDVDEADTPHVALALELDALLWTGDKRLKGGLENKGFQRFFEPGEYR
ncbi:MAG: PIN domain-containing protein [Chloroflexi bacterium]|nr:PIN domain-containing protein [Chloroflexota bacterium]